MPASSYELMPGQNYATLVDVIGQLMHDPAMLAAAHVDGDGLPGSALHTMELCREEAALSSQLGKLAADFLPPLFPYELRGEKRRREAVFAGKEPSEARTIQASVIWAENNGGVPLHFLPMVVIGQSHPIPRRGKAAELLLLDPANGATYLVGRVHARQLKEARDAVEANTRHAMSQSHTRSMFDAETGKLAVSMYSPGSITLDHYSDWSGRLRAEEQGRVVVTSDYFDFGKKETSISPQDFTRLRVMEHLTTIAIRFGSSDRLEQLVTEVPIIPISE